MKPNHTIPLAEEDLYELVASVAGEPVNLVGYSMGGMIAQEFAIRHPELTKRVVLINTDCGGEEAVSPGQWVWDYLNSTPDTIEKYIERAGQLLLTENWRKEHPDPDTWFPDHGEPSSEKAISEQSEAMASWEGTFTRLENITAPVLIISGDKDIVVPPDNALILASEIPDAHHIIIKDGGHGAIFQYPGDIADVIRLFLEDDQMEEPN